MRLASFMKGILSQRLLKRVCPHCGRWEVVKESFLLSLEPHVQSAIKQMGIKKHLVGKGCKECDYTGYKGRVLVSEFVEFTKEIAEAVLKGEITRFEFDNLIEGQGFRTILKDALYRVRLGETNLYQVVERL
jgi:general secretion pathway protein E